MITFLKKKGQDQTEAYIDLEEKLAAILKASQCTDQPILTLSFIDQNLIPFNRPRRLRESSMSSRSLS